MHSFTILFLQFLGFLSLVNFAIWGLLSKPLLNWSGFLFYKL